jgi:cellobiose phosphorylase
MKRPLWKFIDEDGSFVSLDADKIKSLYFPLCNSHPTMSSITPDLHGDLKTGNNSFLLEPVSRIDLSNSKSSRNLWIYINPEKSWSATGVSKDLRAIKEDKFGLKAGFLWHAAIRENMRMGLRAEVTSFIPSSGEAVEIMLVEITNISNANIKFTPTAAIPVYARSSDNLRDHRHVSSLLNRICVEASGVIVTPTLLFDESGHRKNHNSYFVFGIDSSGKGPKQIYPSQECFTGDGSDLEAPDAILKDIPPNKKSFQGKEAMAGLKFSPLTLKPRQSSSYIIVMGVTDDKKKSKSIFNKFNSVKKVFKSLDETKGYWQRKSSEVAVKTEDRLFDNWVMWVGVQPTLRKIFGCSFLPDFDYGRGGRGWRDLWQDCLSLILNNPEKVRSMLVNNFAGVRIDGSNATIIGQRPGEFIADRNNIARVWMDHGIWPLITTHLYIHNTGDIKILLEDVPYFRDHWLSRNREIDRAWNPQYGRELKTRTSRTYRGTILEHMLAQNLVQFFNVGPHNHIRLENADWNDGLDMAAKYGESVAFTSMYGRNLESICEMVGQLGQDEIIVLKELRILLDSITSSPIDYDDINQKHRLLNNYFNAVKAEVSGERIAVSKDDLISDLMMKASWIRSHIRKNEWLKEGFFNGYYDNDKNRVDGKSKGSVMMTLTGQVFPVMSGIASDKDIAILFKNAKKYLKDTKLGGFRLNTDFKAEMHSLGRAFSFAYGDKENGAFFNHMAVMFAYGLYFRKFAREGFEVLDSIYKMAVDTETSKIYPCLPEYFDGDGRGMYSYLTGSASWYMLTLLTQVYGVRGSYGDLELEPKLVREQFSMSRSISISATFAGKHIEVRYINNAKKDYGNYFLTKVSINGKAVANDIARPSFLIPRSEFLRIARQDNNLIEVTLD